MLSVLGNLSYAGMRAQGSDNSFARGCAFVVGFPGTLVSYLAVEEGGHRLYGVDLPRGLSQQSQSQQQSQSHGSR